MSTGIKYPYYKPEVWGGIECTINRVDNKFRDQLQQSGHYTRAGDIERFAALGIRKLRYPVLWEHHQPFPDQPIDWNWTEQQLNVIRANGIIPIAGLLHHGSGPAFTHLGDKDFPELFAAYAAMVAEKFPWLEYYTPVNEPLTTARFSGLYGLWYPHHRDEKSFVRMMVNQGRATILAMQAIRRINPSAKLVQTEDLAKIHSTPLLAYQACFENERRWLTNDLLCGKLDSQHYFRKYFIDNGITEEELDFFIQNSCPPDIMGFNYYVTSERYLDERTENYPACMHGGNGIHTYVDTEAVRVIQPAGLKSLLKEAWDRYGLPMAITESHLSCSREEQLRWLGETWDACCRLKKQGIDIRAVTAWSLLGAFDWNSVLTCDNNYYEPGVFDLRNNLPRPTALAKQIHSLSTKGKFDHPLMASRGWWHKNSASNKPTVAGKMKNPAPLLIIGQNGTLGHAFTKICEHRSIPHIPLSRLDLDISKEEEILKAIDQYKPWAIINAAGYVRVDDAETDSNECFAVNATAPGLLATACNRKGIRFMTFSSDLVFDGNKKAPYHEGDDVKPLNVYGESKAEGERMVLDENSASLIIRTSAFFGPWDKYNFVYTVLDSLKNGSMYAVAKDVIVSPTYVPDLANTALDLFIDEEKGIWHLSNEGMLTWADFAGMVAERAGYEKKHLHSKPLAEMGWKAQRPMYSVLQSEKGVKLPVLDDALHRYFEQCVAWQ